MRKGLSYHGRRNPVNNGASLAFNFLNGQGLDPSITFSRASNATQFNSAGTLVYAPHNLILDSEDWSTASWNRLSCTFIYNAATAPNGTLTADLLIPNNGSILGRATQTISTLQDFVPVTFSVYVKSSGLTNLVLTFTDKAGTVYDSQVLNSATGVLSGSVAAGTTTTAVLEGSNWYRLIFSVNSSASGATTPSIVFRCSNTGDGTNGVLLWGAQLNVGSLQSYNQTTSSAYYGPRLDYNPATLAAQGLLIEEARTNSIRNNTMQGAVAGTPGTPPTNWALGGISGGLATQVVGTGTENGITYIDIRIFGTNSSGSSVFPGVFFDTTTGIAGTTGQIWSESLYLSLAAGTGVSFDLAVHEADSGGAFLRSTTIAGTSGVPTSGALNTRRRSGSLTLGASTAFVRPLIATTVTNGSSIDITLRIGLPQLELGAFATSVIPTTTTALTRSADVASVNTLSPWYNASAGTIYAEATPNTPTTNTANQIVISIDDTTTNNRIQLTRGGGGGAYSTLFSVAGVVGYNPSLGTWANQTSGKLASAFTTADQKFAYVGALDPGAGTGAIPSVTRMLLGARADNTLQFNGWLRRVVFYPRRLSNAELQAITA